MQKSIKSREVLRPFRIRARYNDIVGARAQGPRPLFADARLLRRGRFNPRSGDSPSLDIPKIGHSRLKSWDAGQFGRAIGIAAAARAGGGRCYGRGAGVVMRHPVSTFDSINSLVRARARISCTHVQPSYIACLPVFL